MIEAPATNELNNALQMFETCLETPLVPGELEAWSESLHLACSAAKELWVHASQIDHPDQFKQMRHEDPEMNSRIQSLQEEDMAIACQFDAVCQDVANFHKRSSKMEEDEGRFESVREDLVKEGLNLVIRIRTQEQAIRTWYLEAFDRDRGNAD